ncbi:MAG: glycosyltransferase [Caldilineaceae bacterium]|nr:glycosyltransferase [Caldilineaceae bacterium]
MHVCHLSSVHRALDGRIFYREACSLVRSGHAATVIARHPRDEVVDGVQVLGLASSPRWARPLLWCRLIERAVSVKADIYQIHDPELLLLLPRLKRRTGRPIVYDVHEANADFAAMKAAKLGASAGAAGQIVERLEPRLAGQCAGIIAADERIAATFAHLPRPAVTLYNYPTREFIQEAAAAPAIHEEPVILHLGTHTKERGAHLLLDAFAAVCAGVPRARLLLAGPFHPAALEDEMRARAAALGLADRVIFTGRLPFATVSRYLRQAMVGWIPLQATPKYEKNIPTKLFEYMAYGLPVVSSDLASVRPYLAGSGAGLLVSPADPAAHAAALLALLRNPRQAASMGAAGRVLVVARYNWAAMEGKMAAFYGEVVRGN